MASIPWSPRSRAGHRVPRKRHLVCRRWSDPFRVHSYVALLGSQHTLFDYEIMWMLLGRSKGLDAINAGIAASVSLLFWLIFARLTSGLSKVEALTVFAVHAAGPVACLAVLVSTVVDRGTDMVYFWICLLQMNFFSAVFGAVLLGVRLVSTVEPSVSRVIEAGSMVMRRVRAPAILVLVALIGFGLHNARSVAVEHWEQSVGEICDILGASRCRTLHGANDQALIAAMGRISPAAKIASLVRSRFSEDHPLLLVIDKRTGFFSSAGGMCEPQEEWLLLSGFCWR